MKALALGCLFFLAETVSFPQRSEAQLLWSGDPSKGTSIFVGVSGGECVAPGSITPATDPAKGAVWRYDKPVGSNRCESRGIKVNGAAYTFMNGATYYLGWWSKLTNTANNNANFQWKSYGSHTQNYPLFMKMVDGNMCLFQRQPGVSAQTIWSTPLMANTWHHYVIGIHLSDQLTGGWIELWHNGIKQTFKDGSQRFAGRTLDDINHPKWGIYGGPNEAITNFITGLKVGMSFADVAPDATATAAPDAGVSDATRATDSGSARDARSTPDAGTNPDLATDGAGSEPPGDEDVDASSMGGRGGGGGSMAPTGGHGGVSGTGGNDEDDAPDKPASPAHVGASGCSLATRDAHGAWPLLSVLLVLAAGRRWRRPRQDVGDVRR